MAKNRKSAKKSKEKRLNNFQDLENEYDFHTTQFQVEEETLAEINKIKASVTEDIRKVEEEIGALKLAKASRD